MTSSTTRDGVNPLRPYYRAPTIGGQSDAFSRANNSSTSTSGNAQYASKARDMFPDLDYRDYVNDPSPSTIRSVKEFVDELLWKYTSVLMAQPFEVAKTILQVRLQDDVERLATAAAVVVVDDPRSRIVSPTKAAYDEVCLDGSQVWDDSQHSPYEESDSDDEHSYFTTNAPFVQTPTPPTRSSKQHTEPTPIQSPVQAKKPELPSHQLVLRRPDSILDVIIQLWSKESAWGVWKGSNATFLYTVLQSLLENWSRSLLSALLNVPDLGVKDDVDRLVEIASPYPWASLCVAASAAVATGLILAPLDLVRTRLILTPTSRGSRRTISTMRALPSWVCPSSLIPPTILHSLIHPILTLSTPLVLRSQFLIDRELSPTTFSVAKFCTSCVSLFVKLPLETVLRRGQAAVLRNPAHIRALEESGKMDTIVEPGPYYGVVGTMYSITTEEGSHAVPVTVKNTKAKKGKQPNKQPNIAEVVYKKGQGMEGLWRGYKVSWWGLVGLWTASMVGAGGEGAF